MSKTFFCLILAKNKLLLIKTQKEEWETDKWKMKKSQVKNTIKKKIIVSYTKSMSQT